MTILFKHYKGGLYEFITSGIDADSKEEKAVFRNVQTGVVWIRPLAEFNATVEVNGQYVPRFVRVSDSEILNSLNR